ncbi:MAG: sensor histidine kinase [Gammaproteobacteria bacterium]
MNARTRAPTARSVSFGGVLARLLDRRHEHWLLASMLLVLQAAIDGDLGATLSRALMITHLGLFFLWQPIWQKDERLQLPAIGLVAVLVGAVVTALGWWMLFAWLVILTGLVAGRSFTTRQERYVYMLSLAFLVIELLINATAPLFLGAALPAAVTGPFRIGLYLLPLVLFAIPPITTPSRDPFPVDFFRGITFALMTALLAVASALVSFRAHIEYPIALVGSLMALGLLLLLLSWMTSPGSGAGLLSVWEKSVLNIGTPFEAWLGNIANLAAQRDDADDFLEAAIEELNDIPWISGVEWRTATTTDMVGQRSRHHLAVETDQIRVTLYTERSFSSALLIHCRLLIQVLGHFYVAKQRENKEASEAHLRAIYETGARVTHDIKNLLQSLNTMAGALETATTAEQEHRGFNLLKRRLPDIAARLNRALEKLQDPARPSHERVAVGDWWAALNARLQGTRIETSVVLESTTASVPGECFDSVVDNLLDNALQKVAAGKAGAVRVELVADAAGVQVSVSDDGPAIGEDVARKLLREPVPSLTGHGIGLYQAARQAELAGCELTLAENRAGRVRFALGCCTGARR